MISHTQFEDLEPCLRFGLTPAECPAHCAGEQRRECRVDLQNCRTKVTSNGRPPHKIKSGIYEQPLIGSYSNFKLKLKWLNKNWKCLKLRQPQMEDDLKILKVKHLRNYWSDLPQTLNLCIGNQTKIRNCSKWIQHPIEDDLKIIIVYTRWIYNGVTAN